MDLQKQVCSLKYAKALNKVGIIQKSLFYWKVNEIQSVISENQLKEFIEKYLPNCNKYYSAFTAAELVQMNRNICGIEFSENENKFFTGDVLTCIKYYSTFSDALADKIYTSLRKGWITVEEINERLIK